MGSCKLKEYLKLINNLFIIFFFITIILSIINTVENAYDWAK